MSLPTPPSEWLEAHGYIDRWHGWYTLSAARQADARAIYEYEQREGKSPPPNFPEGTDGFAQWTYRGKEDPTEVAA